MKENSTIHQIVEEAEARILIVGKSQYNVTQCVEFLETKNLLAMSAFTLQDALKMFSSFMPTHAFLSIGYGAARVDNVAKTFSKAYGTIFYTFPEDLRTAPPELKRSSIENKMNINISGPGLYRILETWLKEHRKVTPIEASPEQVEEEKKKSAKWWEKDSSLADAAAEQERTAAKKNWWENEDSTSPLSKDPSALSKDPSALGRVTAPFGKDTSLSSSREEMKEQLSKITGDAPPVISNDKKFGELFDLDESADIEAFRKGGKRKPVELGKVSVLGTKKKDKETESSEFGSIKRGLGGVDHLKGETSEGDLGNITQSSDSARGKEFSIELEEDELDGSIINQLMDQAQERDFEMEKGAQGFIGSVENSNSSDENLMDIDPQELAELQMALQNPNSDSEEAGGHVSVKFMDQESSETRVELDAESIGKITTSETDFEVGSILTQNGEVSNPLLDEEMLSPSPFIGNRVALTAFKTNELRGYVLFLTDLVEPIPDESQQSILGNLDNYLRFHFAKNPQVRPDTKFDFSGLCVLSETKLFLSLLSELSTGIFVIEGSSPPITVEESINPEMNSINIDRLDLDIPANFDVYIRLDVNQKFLKYLRVGGTLDEKQKERLQAGGIQRIHIYKSEQDKFESYCRRIFAYQKLKEWVKAKLTSNAA